jgi:hypothetical protein
MKILKVISQILFGKEVALALTVLKLIARAIGVAAPGELSNTVYKQLPKRWKALQGTATQDEFKTMISRGVDFYRAVRYVVS